MKKFKNHYEAARQFKQNIIDKYSTTKATVKDLELLLEARLELKDYTKVFQTKLYSLMEYCRILEDMEVFIKRYKLQ